jgi:hypothetical protein
VYYNYGNNEYVVRVYRGGKHYAPTDYFTDAIDDAQATARAMVVEEDKA